MSREALDAVLRDLLSLGPPTSLTERALALYGADDPIELQHRFTRRDGYGRAELVRMSPVLLDEADRGDKLARQIVTRAGRAMGGQGWASAERIEVDVAGAAGVMGGGLFLHPTTVLEHAVMSELPGGVPVCTALPPVIGAVMAALDHVRRGIRRRCPQRLAGGLQRPSGHAAVQGGSRRVLSEAVARAARQRSEEERETQRCVARRWHQSAWPCGCRVGAIWW